MSNFARVLICGSRDFTDRDYFFTAMEKWIAKHGTPSVVIEGCARGADNLAGHVWAPQAPGVYVEHYPAQWNNHNSYSGECWCKDKTTAKCSGAGPLRNQGMLTEGKPDAVIAFSPNLATSRGTADMVRRARKAGLPVWLPIPQPQQTLKLDNGVESSTPSDF